MPRKNQIHHQPLDETAELKSRLEETEETLRAIQEYMVDAFVVNRENGIQVVTLNESEIPYRMMVESMNEGAVTVIPDGTIFYCNSRFGEMLEADCEKLIGTLFHNLIAAEERSTFEVFLSNAKQTGMRGEFNLQTTRGKLVPVQLSVYQLVAGEKGGLAVIATDIRERVEAEQKIRALASKLAVAEQEERHRISQILHDDLQQRLFAIKTQVTFLKEDVEKITTLPDLYENLDQIQRWISDSIAITRSLSIDLSPVILQGEGLSEAIRWLATQMKEQYGLVVNMDVKGDLHFPDAHMRVMLFQAVREALFNVVKHAGTLQTEVTLERVDGRGRITIRDTGRGFDKEKVLNDPTIAHGLLIVQDRLNLLGCQMEIRSQPGEGTHVIIEPPVERIAT
jgi:two-component system CheB/CheR fusion protein